MTQNTRGLYLGSVGVGTTSPYRQVQAIAIVDENGDQVSSFGGAGVGGGLTDTQLRASPVPVAPNVQLGSGVITATTTRVTLATDGPTVSSLASIDNKQAVPRTPTTTSVSSSITSTLMLASNANRRGLSVANDSTATLRLSFSNPATSANCFLVMPPNSFILLDQQLIITNAIYGLWSSANGTAQVTEFI